MKGEEGAEVRGRAGLKDGHEEGKNGWAKEWVELCSGKWLRLIRHETRPGVAKEMEGEGELDRRVGVGNGGGKVGEKGWGTRPLLSSSLCTLAGRPAFTRIGPQSICRL